MRNKFYIYKNHHISFCELFACFCEANGLRNTDVVISKQGNVYYRASDGTWYRNDEGYTFNTEGLVSFRRVYNVPKGVLEFLEEEK